LRFALDEQMQPFARASGLPGGGDSVGWNGVWPWRFHIHFAGNAESAARLYGHLYAACYTLGPDLGAAQPSGTSTHGT
jgi:hypothetical protein